MYWRPKRKKIGLLDGDIPLLLLLNVSRCSTFVTLLLHTSSVNHLNIFQIKSQGTLHAKHSFMEAFSNPPSKSLMVRFYPKILTHQTPADPVIMLLCSLLMLMEYSLSCFTD